MFSKRLDLRELISLEEWQRIQDSFSAALEVTLRTVSLDGRLLTRVSRPNRLCAKILLKSSAYSDFCGKCILKTDIINFREIKEETNFKCPFDLDLFVVPVTTVGNRTLAHIIIGPIILNRRKDASEYTECAQKIGIELEELMDALIDINVLSYNKSYALNKLIGDNFSYIAQTAHHKKRLGEMAPEIRKMDPLFSRYYEEKLFNSLLNACTLALEADSGSVMTLDKKTSMLHIKVASKLDEDVVNNTEIKIGEGIAGVAIATAKPIILPKDREKNGLSEKMKRGYIKSSMIVPFTRPLAKENSENGNDIYGVINLNIMRKDKEFTEKDIAFVQELLNLASTALISFQQNNSL